MLIILKANIPPRSKEKMQEMLSDLLEMKKRGVILLDGRYEWPPVCIDDDTKIVFQTNNKGISI